MNKGSVLSNHTEMELQSVNLLVTVARSSELNDRFRIFCFALRIQCSFLKNSGIRVITLAVTNQSLTREFYYRVIRLEYFHLSLS